jgi:hypothetical protein
MRFMPRGLAGALVALTTMAAGLHAQAPQARAVLPGIDVPIMLDTMALEFPIAGARDSIYAALLSVFQELKIPVQTANPKAGLLNNLNADISRRLGGERLSRYIDCGRGFSGPNADYYRVTLAVSAWVEPATGEPKQLMVAIAASGRDPSGSRSYYAQCTSRGDLEKRIATRVQEIVKPG